MPDTKDKLIRTLFQAIETGDKTAVLACYRDDAIQTEYPNAMQPTTANRTKSEMAEGFDRGKALLERQRFEIVTLLSPPGDLASVEVVWTGTLATGIAGKSAGDELVARIAMVFRFKDGLIAAQRNYDCYDPL